MRQLALLLCLSLTPSLTAQEENPQKQKKSLLDKLRGDLRELDERDDMTAQRTRLRKLQKRTETLRQLQFKRPVRMAKMDRAELMALSKDVLTRELPRARLLQMQLTLQALRLLPAPIDLRTLLVGQRAQRTTGRYDPSTQKMVLTDNSRPRDLAWIRQLTHALEDQHFGLESLARASRSDADQQLALSALVEGSATLAMLRSLVGRRASSTPTVELLAGMTRLQELAPRPGPRRTQAFRDFQAARSLAAYREGLRFVRVLHERGGWGAIDKAYRNPPRSTQQVLHPRKYLGRKTFTPISLPPLVLGPDYRSMGTNHFGELQLRLLLRHHLRSSNLAAGLYSRLQKMGKPGLLRGIYDRTIRRLSPVEMATGLASDTYRVYQPAKGRPTMIWRTQWEDENNAQEFAAAYARVLAQTHGTRRWFERRTWQITRQGRTSAVRRKERRVDVLIDVPAARWRSVVNGLR